MKRRTDQGGSLSLNKEVEDGAWKAEKEEVGDTKPAYHVQSVRPTLVTTMWRRHCYNPERRML